MSRATTKFINVGDIQVDVDKSEWVVVAKTHIGLSRVRRNSLAHYVHAQTSPEIAKTLTGDTPFKSSQ